MDMTLVVMAAGLGSRYGGVKQIERLGPDGEILMEYAIYDALRAGFDRIVLIIKPQMLQDVRALFGDRIEQRTGIRIDYAFQTPERFTAARPELAQRQKPLGTVHAVLCARDAIETPFAVINADDFYGRGAIDAIAAALPELCPQFHLSMQSGCDATLKRMNRKYDTARYLESVTLLNHWFDRPAVTTDMIVGFPEETEEEFAASLDFIRRCGFAQMHIFPYSVRPGTPAAGMMQITKAVKEERAHRAAAVAEEMHRAYLNGCVGQTYPVLFEQPKNGKFAGHAPNYMEVLAEGTELHNKVRNVTITAVEGESLLGRIQED